MQVKMDFLATKEKEIKSAIANLKDIFPHIKFEGFRAMEFTLKNKKRAHQLYVYMYHDQGLSHSNKNMA